MALPPASWPVLDTTSWQSKSTTSAKRHAEIQVDLRMLRYAIQYVSGKNYQLASSHTIEYHTSEHTATSRLGAGEGQISLTQQFHEGDFYDASGIVIAIAGRKSTARFLNESTVQLAPMPGKGKFTILIASAASFDPKQDVAAQAGGELKALETRDSGPSQPQGGTNDQRQQRSDLFAAIAADAENWWHDYWSKSFVSMHSSDGQADFVEQNYTYFLYVMGSSSRGAYPPRFGGMLWYTNGDMRRWGSQYWWANTNAYYSNLMPANRMELLEPLFSLYTGMLDACSLAARAMGCARDLDSGDHLFQRSGDASRRYRRRAAGADARQKAI